MKILSIHNPPCFVSFISNDPVRATYAQELLQLPVLHFPWLSLPVSDQPVLCCDRSKDIPYFSDFGTR